MFYNILVNFLFTIRIFRFVIRIFNAILPLMTEYDTILYLIDCQSINREKCVICFLQKTNHLFSYMTSVGMIDCFQKGWKNENKNKRM